MTDLPKETRVTLPTRFVNGSGFIQNLVEHECGGVALIESVAGSIRANHLHREDWHYLYVLSGRCHYFERPAGSTEKPEGIRVGPGQMIFTPPMVEHAVWFTEPTVVISISRFGRTHEQHEADVVRLTELMIPPEYMKQWKGR